MPKKEIVDCLKRTAQLLWNENASLKQIDYLGHRKLPFKRRTPNEGEHYTEADFFIYHVSINQKFIHKIKPEIKLDLDIIRATWNLQNQSDLPQDYECTLQEESAPPYYRPSIQALLYNKNVRLTNPKMPQRHYHSSSVAAANVSTQQSTSSKAAPGLLSIFEQNPKRLHRIQFLGQLFNQSGHEIRIAGGAVRDILNGHEPGDIDFATTSLPEESLNLVKQHEDMMRVIVTAAGQKHGTVAVKFKGLDDVDFGRLALKDNKDATPITENSAIADSQPIYDEESPFEITTLRCDHVTDGRHAEVVFIRDWKMDAERRDLTINAMFLTLDKGEIIDYFDGQKDLKHGIVRFVGNADQRIKEDYLRILRYLRFWSRYGQNNPPDEKSSHAIRQNLDGLDKISGERIWTELKKIFSVHPPSPVVKVMLDMKLFDYIGVQDKGKPINNQRVENEIKLIEERVQDYSRRILGPALNENPNDVNLKKMKEILSTILFSTILETPEMCMNALARLKFSNYERDTLLYIIANRDNNDSYEPLTTDILKRELVNAPPSEITLARNKMYAFLIYSGKLDWLNEIESWQIPVFPIRGLDVSQEIIKRKIPRHRIKNILQSLRDEWALSKFELTKEDLWKILQNNLETYQEETQNKLKS